jgi:hypothetical protein
MPLQPTAIATAAAIRPRQARPVADLALQDGDISTAIGDVLNPAF